MASALCASLGAYALSTADAADIDIAAQMVASVAITLTPVSDLDFGSLEFTTGAHSGDVELGSDGTIALAGGATGLVLGGTPTAGQFTVQSTSGSIQISCDTTGTIGDGTRDLTVSVVKWDYTAANFASTTNTCAGLATFAGTLDTGANNNPNVFIGANLNIGANALDGSVGGTAYDTATGGGDPVTFRVVFI